MTLPDTFSSAPAPGAIAACFDDIAAESFAEIGGDGRMAAEARRRGIARVAHLEAVPSGGAPSESFDVVYSGADLLRNLLPLIPLVRRRLVLDTPILAWRDLWRGDLDALKSLVFNRPVTSGDHGAHRYSESALRDIFNHENAVFEPITIVRGEDGRATVVADKRRIGHMVVVCAPTSGGKSTIARRIIDDAAFRRNLGIADADWEVMKAEDFFTRAEGALPHVIVMYNLLRRLNKAIAADAEDPLPMIFREAERLTMITLVTTPERLRTQFRQSEMPDPKRRYSEKILRLERAYRDDSFLADWYRAWFRFQDGLEPGRAAKWLIAFGPEGERVICADEWQNTIDSYFGAKR